MNQGLSSLVVFGLLWVVTFFPAWWLLLKLLALSASPQKISWRFWMLLFVYRILIALPYIGLLVVGDDVLPDIFEAIIIGFVIAGIMFSLLRFLFRTSIINWLWWVYGFVYDGLLHYAPYRRLVRTVIKRAKHEKGEAHTVLELGCGTGNVIGGLIDTYPNATVTGVDNSSTMLSIARRKIKNAFFVQDDMIGYIQKQRSNSYDLIIMQNALYAVSDRVTLWKELDRILKDDGVIVMTNSDRAGSFSITREHLKYGHWYELLYPKLICVGIIDAIISQLSKTGSFFFLKEEAIKKETAAYFSMSAIKRVYGDVNILFTLRKQNRNE